LDKEIRLLIPEYGNGKSDIKYDEVKADPAALENWRATIKNRLHSEEGNWSKQAQILTSDETGFQAQAEELRDLYLSISKLQDTAEAVRSELTKRKGGEKEKRSGRPDSDDDTEITMKEGKITTNN